MLMAEAAVAAAKAARPGVLILPACPATTLLIQKEWPYWAENILPVASPLTAHARLLHQTLGAHTAVVGVGSCSAQKLLADSSGGLVHTVLTFSELRAWMLDRYIHPEQFPPTGETILAPWKASRGHTYAVSGGMLRDVMRLWGGEGDTEFLAFAGLRSVRRALTGLETWGHDSKLILELMACDGGCVNGPTMSRTRSMALRKLDVIRQVEEPTNDLLDYTPVLLDESAAYPPKGPDTCRIYSPTRVDWELRKVGKNRSLQASNCGCCGYGSCQRFAIALCNGKAEPSMCVAYQRQVAEEKFEVLLNNMPSGVVVVDGHKRILEANWNLAHMLGQEVELAYDQTPGLRDLSAEELIPFHELLTQVLETGEEILARDVHVDNRLLRVSFFTVQPHQIVCAIARNLYDADVRSEMVVQRTETLIRQNLATVQKIAYLLGENASNTEMELRAILHAFKGDANNE